MKKADKLTGSCGLVRGSLMSADPAKSHIQIKTGSYLDDFACIEIRIVLLNSEGCCVHSGGYPVTVELFDAVGNVLVFAENTKFVSHDIVSESNEVCSHFFPPCVMIVSDVLQNYIFFHLCREAHMQPKDRDCHPRNLCSWIT